jgi:hypothetical protein
MGGRASVRTNSERIKKRGAGRSNDENSCCGERKGREGRCIRESDGENVDV